MISNHINPSEEEQIVFLEHTYDISITSSDADLSYSCLMFQRLIGYLSKTTQHSKVKKIPDKNTLQRIWKAILSCHKHHIQQGYQQLSLPDLEIANGIDILTDIIPLYFDGGRMTEMFPGIDIHHKSQYYCSRNEMHIEDFKLSRDVIENLARPYGSRLLRFFSTFFFEHMLHLFRVLEKECGKMEYHREVEKSTTRDDLRKTVFSEFAMLKYSDNIENKDKISTSIKLYVSMLNEDSNFFSNIRYNVKDQKHLEMISKLLSCLYCSMRAHTRNQHHDLTLLFSQDQTQSNDFIKYCLLEHFFACFDDEARVCAVLESIFSHYTSVNGKSMRGMLRQVKTYISFKHVRGHPNAYGMTLCCLLVLLRLMTSSYEHQQQFGKDEEELLLFSEEDYESCKAFVAHGRQLSLSLALHESIPNHKKRKSNNKTKQNATDSKKKKLDTLNDTLILSASDSNTIPMRQMKRILYCAVLLLVVHL
ncbi:hypothetical protein C9374_011930 [Naegleria lovaniensis]|uniref:Uncharacterized protein n=1 Tax=Naegleria lovaniensis TaxID=51637 RepID=A0AA88KEZ0_NAELO|nr:uncharacterized protein C9374_011930 [Naegleria lovaniensis]KAG2373641.1 hypothetical protein C9374_011930 [Naegleria lovaniensis]